MSDYLDAVIVEHNPTQKKIDRAVILLHGLGACQCDDVSDAGHVGCSDSADCFPADPVASGGALVAGDVSRVPALFRTDRSDRPAA